MAANGRRDWSTHYTVNYVDVNGENVPVDQYYRENSYYWLQQMLDALWLVRNRMTPDDYNAWVDAAITDNMTRKAIHDLALSKWHELPPVVMAPTAPVDAAV